MKFNNQKVASLLALAFVLVMHGGILIQYLSTADTYTLIFSLTLPSTILSTVVAILVAWGLWQNHSWAWWFGLAAGLIHLTKMTAWLSQHYSLSNLPAMGVFVTYGITASFVLVLFIPQRHGDSNATTPSQETHSK